MRLASMRESFEKKAIQALVSNTQSTHNLAAQATAARFLRLLDKRYVETQVLPATFNTTKTQALLIQFITAHIDSLTGKKSASVDVATKEVLQKACPQTLDVIEQLIAHGKSSSNNTDKTTTHQVFLQLKTIINRHPGMAGWNDNHERWSINVIYNAEKKDYETVSASPAETLHLYCAALLDDKHWVSSASSVVNAGQQSRGSE